MDLVLEVIAFFISWSPWALKVFECSVCLDATCDSGEPWKKRMITKNEEYYDIYSTHLALVSANL